MTSNKLYLLGMALCGSILCSAQAPSVSGFIFNSEGEPLAGASVHWLGTSSGQLADSTGYYELPAEGTANQLVASYVGYRADTMACSPPQRLDFQLQPLLGETVLVEGRRAGIIIKDAAMAKTEQITQTELAKSACCDLAGCFETQATVQAQTTNVVTNAKSLRVLGLSGVYNQVLIDGLPMVQGLSYTYGISSIPGTLVDNIYIAKGANSVLQGYESMSGQINVTTKVPDDTERLLLNAYVNSFQERHFNANYAFQKGKWSNLTAAHIVRPAERFDRDKDGFLDLPLLSRYSIFNKWKYGQAEAEGWSSSISVRYLDEQRTGGQTGFEPEQHEGGTDVYGQTVHIRQADASAKAGYRFNSRHNIAFMASAFQQQQDAFFGNTAYEAEQLSAYANVQYELNYKTHELKAGLSYRYLNLEEDLAFTDGDPRLQRSYAGNYLREEQIPGVFAEHNSRFFDGKLSWTVGLRHDWHNEFGSIFTPRSMLKYDLMPRSVLRASIGKGWRTVNLFSENIGMLASSRDIIIDEQGLAPEQAINYGLNLTHKFEEEIATGYFSVDYYRTTFQNQVFPDYDQGPSFILVQNFRGPAISNSFQAELYAELGKRWAAKLGYTYLDVYRKLEGDRQVLPFNPKHRFLATLNYEPLSKAFQVDANLHLFGKQRLPTTSQNPASLQRPDFSQAFALLNAQFTYRFSPAFEAYAGGENLLDFRQLQPIIGSNDPFGPYFDTSSAWGPTRGRELYLGLRFRLD